MRIAGVLSSELVRVQYLHHVTEIGDAGIIVEKLRCDLI
ncbi:hypothetical protein NSP_19920 [Nodularia spumigena CCY9414]|nr:hypothetical protein NSP_19920 [Nodularia spumigena CCY9414]